MMGMDPEATIIINPREFRTSHAVIMPLIFSFMITPSNMISQPLSSVHGWILKYHCYAPYSFRIIWDKIKLMKQSVKRMALKVNLLVLFSFSLLKISAEPAAIFPPTSFFYGHWIEYISTSHGSHFEEKEDGSSSAKRWNEVDYVFHQDGSFLITVPEMADFGDWTYRAENGLFNLSFESQKGVKQHFRVVQWKPGLLILEDVNTGFLIELNKPELF